MKTKLFITFFIMSLCIGITSCVSVRVKSKPNKEIPSGQIKKVTGSKSAKYYTPGHNK